MISDSKDLEIFGSEKLENFELEIDEDIHDENIHDEDNVEIGRQRTPKPQFVQLSESIIISRESLNENIRWNRKRLTVEELKIGTLLYPERFYWRPKTRGDCKTIQRPCAYIGCKYHLYLDEHKGNVSTLDSWEMKKSCALDIADAGEHTLEEIGDILNVTRERVRQIQDKALKKLNKDNPKMLSHVK